ncbi:hypothetical protein GGX14DRAFT_524384 [Mycena pura]|uniref:NACHT domain-containing protein n=1 Tax=Mycena pura TaxID=153505 RepID=A0AAD6V3E6_9AGAR|nr:hypothetical protein GGX14DRAFT_524384 [Mycena pura]
MSATNSTPTAQPETGTSIFQDALNLYLEKLDEKKSRKSTFIAKCKCTAEEERTGPKELQSLIKDMEVTSGQRKKPLKKILSPIIEGLKTFDDVMKAVVAVDPTPASGVIWAAISLIVKGVSKNLEVFDKIARQLNDLKYELERLQEYEDLYEDSNNMRELLVHSYVCILRFWAAVETQCSQSLVKGSIKKAFSYDTTKLDGIITDIKDNADGISKLADIVEARRAAGAREDAQEEWKEAKLERIEARKHREAVSKFHDDHRYREVCDWLSSQDANAIVSANESRHSDNINRRTENTCQWLVSNPLYVAWNAGGSSAQDTISTPIVWIHGPPGSGKTFLCSKAIQETLKQNPDCAIAYHFFRFDTGAILETTILRVLARSLFESYWARHHRIPETLYHLTQSNSASLERVQEVLRTLANDSGFPSVFFFLDGLDEELGAPASHNHTGVISRWTVATSVVRFIAKLVQSSNVVRFWCGSQMLPPIKSILDEYSATALDIKEKAKEDVQFFLLNEVLSQMAALEIPPLKGTEMLLDLMLRAQAEGNFLWARFMVDELKEAADSRAKFAEFLARNNPSGIDGQYQLIIDRIPSNVRQLACEVFSLVAFAQRPLLIQEIQAAIAILRKPDANPTELMDHKPQINSLFKVLAPLIEVHRSGDDDTDDNDTCHLFHSTVRTFLGAHPDVFKLRNSCSHCKNVSSCAIARSCLSYLSQDRYSNLLVQVDGQWQDKTGDSINDHRFLIYAAKYWDKHLDDLRNFDNPIQIGNQVKAFLLSPAFQTCLQVQSLWVGSQFGIFTREHTPQTFLRRALPKWFVDAEEFVVFLRSYRLFLREWRLFLDSTQRDTEHVHYAGQVDRCWYRALGQDNFLFNSKERYCSFVVRHHSDSPSPAMKNSLCEGLCATGATVKVLRLESHDAASGAVSLRCEHWLLKGPEEPVPTLIKQQTLSTDEGSTNWGAFQASDSSVGRAPPAAFFADCSILRLGTQVFALDSETMSYLPLRTDQVDDPGSLSYAEECAVRGNYVVLATRRRIVLKRPEKIKTVGKECTDSGSESGEESSEPETDDEAYETWSECSSEISDDPYEEDFVTPWAGPPSDIDEDDDGSDRKSKSESVVEDSTSDSDSGYNSAVKGEEEVAASDTDSEASYVPPNAILEKDTESVKDDCDSDSDDGIFRPNRPIGIRKQSTSDKSADEDKVFASITIRDGENQMLFNFTHHLRYLLHESPPIIHPRFSLLVWPLSCGDILFADFSAKTYFIRRIRPSTAHTRHIFMKCHFSESSSGSFLHVVSLEGQLPKKSDAGMKLALLVSTYSLCRRKPSRSPPVLVYRTRISLGTVQSLKASKLPFTVTWKDTELYFTACGEAGLLRLYRIALFRNANSAEDSQVLVPTEHIFLPETARHRKVYFFPGAPHKIIVGSEQNQSAKQDSDGGVEDDELVLMYYGEDLTGETLRPPIGCYLKDSDLGDWVSSTDQSTIPDDLGIGQFDRLMERFNPEDDCILEPYLF